jgi:hypothetical protein
MMLLMIFAYVGNPFYAANFTPLPIRSMSMFSNPAGLGIRTGAEAFVTYHMGTETITSGASANNLGFGVKKADTVKIFELGLGYKLPGAFSLGYAFQFGDTTNHILGIEARATQKWSLGYKTTIGTKKHMYGGIAVMPYEDYLTLNFEVEYEGIDSIFTFYYGVQIRPYKGIGAYFFADKEFDWNAGLEISLGYVKFAGLYSSADKKLSGGLIFSAQKYQSLMNQLGFGQAARSEPTIPSVLSQWSKSY